jgi:hypothetical protein
MATTRAPLLAPSRRERLRRPETARQTGSPGVAYEIVDMVRANRTGLAVIDGSSAMEGNGLTEGTLVDMNVIMAGTNPLAADMVATALMGISPEEVPACGRGGGTYLEPEAHSRHGVVGRSRRQEGRLMPTVPELATNPNRRATRQRATRPRARPRCLASACESRPGPRAGRRTAAPGTRGWRHPGSR